MAKGIVNGGLNGGGGSNIKSIQRGETVINNAASLNVTIASVDLSKSIVKITTFAEGTTFLGPQNRSVKGKLTTATNLNLTVNSASAVNTFVSWEVVEFNNVKSVQRGDIALTANTTKSVAISAVNIDKSLLFISHITSSSETSGYLMSVKLTSATNLDLKCIATSNAHWQVIEFN